MAGRPPLYPTPEDLEQAIEAYFTVPVYKSTKQGKIKTTDTAPREKVTIAGLAYHLGFESRQSFYDYEERPEFSYIVKKARLRVEMNYEERLSDPGCTGAIFALKNMGWKDKTEQEVNLSGGLNLTIQPAEGNEPIQI